METKQDIKEIIKLHIRTYDSLAVEYEKRIESLYFVTKKNTDWMSKYVRKNGQILDVGCGVGSSTNFFIKKGFKLTCIDISSRMLFYTQKRNPNAVCINGDFLITNFKHKFDGVFAFAFIHLFPKLVVFEVLKKIHKILNTEGVAFIESTKSDKSSEGYEVKMDYSGEYKRYRKHWTKKELKEILIQSHFKILDSKESMDPFGKSWISFIVQKN
ncbi:TPA: hypothetical protein DEP30_03805 [Candidatus Nomurabacteria bacterium]|nr:MAG: Methyltransferase [Candidatus Nomurabacteria bacterium GW2011_GWF2_36_126]KKP96351.1 MAG: Methyltransferase [Candidatus Nomurabacteria bacterium GW2011_GWD2_36_14]KKP99012.1 MAG: Methyltransferase [Candidatus Nomurabacteria bacterium GW2011_GWF2_36_19]KKQ05178.1 MAG: Methyltransferase [Candidatus Nomurabacteria bacterium GW2011_GWF1_36_47]KKQ09163.1 MAG: Methyltransferase [Candidatus Nomurabacteria bacterium GW2011_GWB1_36_6]KKQ12712.1 MAG: Methyltransferase [Candidatus Nomurabacteria 